MNAPAGSAAAGSAAAGSAAPIVVRLDSPELTWGRHQIAGAEQPADITMLRADAERGTRAVVVRFPNGWTRDAVGHQPAGEEMVIISGSLAISGLTCGEGEMLIVEPLATRAATSTQDGTAALVWFSGPGGGWADGEASAPGAARVVAVDAALQRPATPALVGTVHAREQAAGEVFEVDVDLFWPGEQTWAFVPAGVAAPQVPGFAIVHTWS
ncbi:DUF4437 domain-containing protein [Nocardioides sp.]|uniref:DUF4437 domain-containing protein n=1 Tax=Nocardioides sp. TaxID=35761 RepID=UPI002630C761|nr:DUF4437 domain-containing protein [Nocardioides sp.]